MRICVTCYSDDPVIDEIYQYCQSHDLVMSCVRLYVVDNQFWSWRIDSESSPALTWLLLKYGSYLKPF
jgi:hypothetical protein